jgi:cell division protein FtsW
MNTFARTDNSLIGLWWWEVDRWTLAALVAIVALGAVLSLAASPAVAERIGLDTFYFARRQFLFLSVALISMAAVSMLSPKGVRRLAFALFAVFSTLTAATLVIGPEIKGATRWLTLGGVSIQPSEFVKPAFAVIAAWLFTRARLDPDFPGNILASTIFAGIIAVLLLQPDVGMTMVVAAVWGTQFFLAGLPLIWVVAIALVFVGGGIAAYVSFAHVQARIDRFLDPAAGEGYQVTWALEAFRNGGVFGRGPGEGRVKEILPDAHADFIFAVVGEEFGLVVCLLVVALFVFVVLRGFARALGTDNLFILIAVAGLLVQVALQTIINMGANLHLIPPKGMTLPFISYGGSSALSLGLGLGMVLALTRLRMNPWRRP